jgi:effector-binding domain-containing protein
MRLLSFICVGFFLASSIDGISQEKDTKFDISIRKVEEIHMVYYDFTGPYDKSFTDFGQLMAFVQKENIEMGPFSLGIFYDDPAVVDKTKLRSKIGIAVTSNAEFKSEKFNYKKIPAGKAITVRYKSMEDIMPAYTAISEYIASNNLKTENYSVELYYGNDPNSIDAEILFYIKDM